MHLLSLVGKCIYKSPMNSVFDLKTFYKLIITPFELELVYSDWKNYILYDTSMIKVEEKLA